MEQNVFEFSLALKGATVKVITILNAAKVFVLSTFVLINKKCILNTVERFKQNNILIFVQLGFSLSN